VTLELKAGQVFASAPFVNKGIGETLLCFQHVVTDDSGVEYAVCARGRAMDDGLWEGWLEFEPVRGGPSVPTGRETTQPNRTDAVYWATGLQPVYLEGALIRALDGRTTRDDAILGRIGSGHRAGALTSKITNSP
jgi:hypothetical protein